MTNYTRYKKNEGIKEIMTPKEITIYKMKREREIPAVKIKFWKNGKVIIRIPYDRELINKTKTISGKNGIQMKIKRFCLFFQRKYISTKSVYINELAEIMHAALK